MNTVPKTVTTCRLWKILFRAFGSIQAKGWQIETEVLGKRPCNGDLDPEKHQALIQRTLEDVSSALSWKYAAAGQFHRCQYSLSLGIPAVTFGLILGGRAHTYEEWIEIDSLRIGCPLAIRTALHYFDEI